MTLIFNPQRAMVVTHVQKINVEGQAVRKLEWKQAAWHD